MTYFKNISALLTAILVMAFLSASPVVAQEQGFDTWDENGDGSLSEDELETVIQDIEYYHNWDFNSNDAISKDEWASAIQVHLEETHSKEDYGEFGKWDQNNDQNIDRDEFLTGVLRTIDGDGNRSISQEEFNKWYDPGEEE